MIHRLLNLCCIVLMICASAPLSARPLKITSVITRHYLNDFSPVSENFAALRAVGVDTILRTDDSELEGIYLVINLNQFVSELSDGTLLKLRYLVSDSDEEKEKSFKINPGHGRSSWIFVGITGADFNRAGQSLLEYSLEIFSGEDHAIRNSYFWCTDEVKRQNCPGLEPNLEL